jgi:hypothetical protein
LKHFTLSHFPFDRLSGLSNGKWPFFFTIGRLPSPEFYFGANSGVPLVHQKTAFMVNHNSRIEESTIEAVLCG